MKIDNNSRVVYRLGNRAGELLKFIERIPAPEPGQVLIELRAISLNYRDLLYLDSEPMSSGLVPGSDGAGIIVKIGEGVSSFKPGDRVMPSFFTGWVEGRYDTSYRQTALGGGIDGTFATHITVPARSLVHIPADISFREAACLPCAAVTAWNALVGRSKIEAGEFVLVQGTGGVSMFAIQIARSLGAHPILISGSQEKIKLAERMGVKHAVNYRDTPEWDSAILNITAGQGCDRIVEVAGGQSMRGSIRCLRPGGTISYIGCLAGFDGDIDILDLMYKNAKLEAIYVGSRRDLACVVQDMQEWGVTAVIDDQTFSFDNLPKALKRLRAGEHVGKIVVELF